MSEVKDLVVGAICGYDFKTIEPWVNSLDNSGFKGTKILLCYNTEEYVLKELAKRNYNYYSYSRDNRNSIVVERFYDMYYILQEYKNDHRYIISTDVKDVIFQLNPSSWFDNNFDAKNSINASLESIQYCNEEWGRNNIIKAFGASIYDQIKNNVICNAGVISGRIEHVLDLFLNISLICNLMPFFISGGGGPDQAAYNIIMNSLVYKNQTQFSPSESGWAAQLGTTGPQIYKKYKDVLVEPTPIFTNGTVCTTTNIPFTIVHQYDRTPWKTEIENNYRD